MNKKAVWSVVTVLGVIPIAGLGAWVSVASTSDQPPSTVQEQPEPEAIPELDIEPVFPVLAAGPRPPGEWTWSELRGGECLYDFPSAFEESYVVVMCSADHQAEFVRATVLDDDPNAPYPGHAWVRREAAALCESWPLSDFNNAGRYDDLYVVPSYSLGEEAWDQGDRLAGCFVFRDSGGLIDGPLVK